MSAWLHAMNDRRSAGFALSQLWAALFLAVSSMSEPALTEPQDRNVSPDARTLFSCHVDRRFALRATPSQEPDQSYIVARRQTVDDEVNLTVDIQSHRLSLLIGSEGHPKMHVLNNVEQGSSGGSGAGGRADTTIRGQDNDGVFTLFAGYDNNGFDHDAALQISGKNNLLLACDSDPYKAPQVRGLGRTGSTNIYVLNADGLATRMNDLPAEPDLEGHR
jgi:hypothetical protein